MYDLHDYDDTYYRSQFFRESVLSVLRQAQQEAERFDQLSIEIEHLLLALLDVRDTIVLRILIALNVEPDVLRIGVDIAMRHIAPRNISGGSGLASRSKYVIDLAVDEARRLNHDRVGTEHLLLALIREGEGIAAKTLDTAGASLERLRKLSLDTLGHLLRHRAHAADGRTLPGARRRSGVYALAVLVLMLATGCAPTTRLTPAPTAIPTATTPPAPTSTMAPEDAFRDELEAITGLRGRDLARGPAFEVERLADVTIVHIFIQLSSPSLPDAQWDAFLMQRALWTGQEFAIPAGWEVSVELFIPSTDPAAGTLGREIGVANLGTAGARHFAWDHLSPQQAWSRYDGTAFNPSGL
jgi:Clp amino terminal domain, pathogenicity island component